MADTYKYKPRFKDIRIKPPGGKASPEEKACDYPKCTRKAEARAPKGRDQLNDYYWFCKSHAADYNKSWNFFEGMSDSAAKAYQESQAYGHRPTWNFTKGGTRSQKAQKASVDWQKAFMDPFSLFGERPPPGHEQTAKPDDKPKHGRLMTKAFETMTLEPGATKSDVRKRYAELVRSYHPDANGGDRSNEDLLQKVVAAYQILRNGGYA